MATWTSGRGFPWRDDHTSYEQGTTSVYTWSYQTTSDYLAIQEVHPEGTRCAYRGQPVAMEGETVHYQLEQAKALYLTLRHWLSRYEGEKELARLDALATETTDE